MSISRITANQSHLSRALKLSGARIRLYIREEPHHSNMSTTTLAKKLATGFQWMTAGGNIVDVPARPMMRQFFAANKVEMTTIIIQSSAWLTQDQNKWDAVAEHILSLFRAWVESGGVSPVNAESTLENKKERSDAAMLDFGGLLASVVAEAELDSLK